MLKINLCQDEPASGNELLMDSSLDIGTSVPCIRELRIIIEIFYLVTWLYRTPLGLSWGCGYPGLFPPASKGSGYSFGLTFPDVQLQVRFIRSSHFATSRHEEESGR